MGQPKLRVPRDFRDARKQAEAAGWRIENTNKSHTRWLSPDGVTVVTVASTPSCWRSHLNALAELRRAGLDV